MLKSIFIMMILIIKEQITFQKFKFEESTEMVLEGTEIQRK